MQAKRQILKKMKKNYLSTAAFQDSGPGYRSNMTVYLNRIWRQPYQAYYLPVCFPFTGGQRRSSRKLAKKEANVE